MKKPSKKEITRRLRSPYFAKLCVDRGLTKRTKAFKRCVRIEALRLHPNRNAAMRREMALDTAHCEEQGFVRKGTPAQRRAFYSCVDALTDRRNRVLQKAADARARRRGA